MKKYTFFWNGFLSQWHPSPFVDLESGLKFNCAEQYMMWKKATEMGDVETAKKIMEAKHPREQKKLGRQVKNFDMEKWHKIKWDVVYNGTKLKFTQNPKLMEQLINTRGTLLVEASPFDKVWGIGLGEEDAKKIDEKDWPGENLLGKIITEFRENICKTLHNM